MFTLLTMRHLQGIYYVDAHVSKSNINWILSDARLLLLVEKIHIHNVRLSLINSSTRESHESRLFSNRFGAKSSSMHFSSSFPRLVAVFMYNFLSNDSIVIRQRLSLKIGGFLLSMFLFKKI